MSNTNPPVGAVKDVTKQKPNRPDVSKYRQHRPESAQIKRAITDLPLLGGTRGNTAKACKLWPSPYGYYAFDVDNIGGGSIVTAGIQDMMCGECVDGILYAYDEDGSFYRFNAVTGAQIQVIADAADPDEVPLDMAYDYTTNTMYGVMFDELYTINLTTGVVSFIDYMDEWMIVCAIDLAGTLFAVDVWDFNLYSINKSTAAINLIGNTGVYDIWYNQSMAFDLNTGIL
jgi:hypothetical protein